MIENDAQQAQMPMGMGGMMRPMMMNRNQYPIDYSKFENFRYVLKIIFFSLRHGMFWKLRMYAKMRYDLVDALQLLVPTTLR